MPDTQPSNCHWYVNENFIIAIWAQYFFLLHTDKKVTQIFFKWKH